MSVKKLTGKQRRHLRALGHHLQPVVQLGRNGLTDAVIAATDEQIAAHELIKVRRGKECPQKRKEVATILGDRLDVEIVQQLGHTILLYRRHPEEPQIELPR